MVSPFEICTLGVVPKCCHLSKYAHFGITRSAHVTVSNYGVHVTVSNYGVYNIGRTQIKTTQPANMFNSTSNNKRKALVDLTNVSSDDDVPLKSEKCNNVLDLMPRLQDKENANPDQNDDTRFQNVHPLLAWYKHDLETGIFSYDKFMDLINPINDAQLVKLLTEIGIVAASNTCLLCGGSMRMMKDGEHWFWVCMRRVDGVKCNKGKKSI